MVSRSGPFLAALLPLFATPALAGNPEPVVPAPAPVAPVPVQVDMSGDWTGFYAGGSLGYADVTGSTTIGDDVNGLTYGVHGGYDYDLGGFVLGGELELSGFDVTDDGIGLDVDQVARAKLRVGYDAGNFLPYAALGVAQLTTSGAIDDEDTGNFYGLGLDFRATDQLRVGGEILQHEFDDYAGSGIDVEALTASARISFEF